MTLLIVRHAHAGVRRDWNGDDRMRPLTERGVEEARLIARRLIPYEPKRIYSSPTARCRQTMEPLGSALDIDVEDDPRLFEGPSRSDIESLLDDLSRKRTTVLSSHGDVVPALLHGLVERGMTHEHRLIWQKGSTWVVDYSKSDGWGTATYLNPPRVR